MGASGLESEAENIGRRFASKIPVIGWGISAVGIGWDIHQGKPPAKAIFSGVAGTLGAIAVVPGGWLGGCRGNRCWCARAASSRGGRGDIGRRVAPLVGVRQLSALGAGGIGVGRS